MVLLAQKLVRVVQNSVFASPGSGTSYNSLNEAKAACEEIVANGGVCGGVTDYYGSEEVILCIY